MGLKVLVAFSTATGTTREVAAAIGSELATAGHTVDVMHVDETKGVEDYDAIVAGTPVMMGMLNGRFKRFMRRNAKKLNSKKVAWFLVCGYLCEPTDENLERARKRLAKIQKLSKNVTPVDTAMFGGAIKKEGADFDRLNPFLKSMVRKVAVEMKDGRDWDAIKTWGKNLAAKL